MRGGEAEGGRKRINPYPQGSVVPKLGCTLESTWGQLLKSVISQVSPTGLLLYLV